MSGAQEADDAVTELGTAGVARRLGIDDGAAPCHEANVLRMMARAAYAEAVVFDKGVSEADAMGAEQAAMDFTEEAASARYRAKACEAGAAALAALAGLTLRQALFIGADGSSQPTITTEPGKSLTVVMLQCEGFRGADQLMSYMARERRK